jgi:hypothetical protein
MAAATTEELAMQALEILLERSRHQRRCRQCRLDVAFCHTNREYVANFERVYKRWERLAEGVPR